MAPVFQGGDLSVIMENGTHKTLFLSGLIQISENFACNPLKLCNFMIHSSLPTQEDFDIVFMDLCCPRLDQLGVCHPD